MNSFRVAASLIAMVLVGCGQPPEIDDGTKAAQVAPESVQSGGDGHGEGGHGGSPQGCTFGSKCDQVIKGHPNLLSCQNDPSGAASYSNVQCPGFTCTSGVENGVVNSFCPCSDAEVGTFYCQESGATRLRCLEDLRYHPVGVCDCAPGQVICDNQYRRWRCNGFGIYDDAGYCTVWSPR